MPSSIQRDALISYFGPPLTVNTPMNVFRLHGSVARFKICNFDVCTSAAIVIIRTYKQSYVVKVFFYSFSTVNKDMHSLISFPKSKYVNLKAFSDDDSGHIQVQLLFCNVT